MNLTALQQPTDLESAEQCLAAAGLEFTVACEGAEPTCSDWLISRAA
jgi:hypothetical protein